MNYEQFVKLSLDLKIAYENNEPFAFTETMVGGTWVAAVIPEFQHEVFSTIASDASNWVGDAMDEYDISEDDAMSRIEEGNFKCKIVIAWLQEDDESDDVEEIAMEELKNFETLTLDLSFNFDRFISEVIGCE